MAYAIYDTTTGQILKVLNAPLDIVLLEVTTGVDYLECPDDTNDRDYYVSSGAITARPALPGSWSSTSIVADGTSAATISSLPNPSTVTIRTNAGSVNPITVMTIIDGSFSLTTTQAGGYFVTISAFPYLDINTLITAS